MTGEALRERHLSEWLWFVIALGVAVRFQGLGWDDWLFFNPDERNIVGGAVKLAFPDRLVPVFNAYNGLALYLPRALAELMEPFTGTAGSDPVPILFAGRILSALWSSLTLLVIAGIAQRAFGSVVSLFVTTCAAAAPGLIQSAHFMTTEAGLMLCLVLLIHLSQSRVRGEIGLMPFATQSAAVLGVGFGLKTTALVFAICPAVAVLVTLERGQAWRPIVAAGAAAGLIVVVLVLLTTPQLWATPQAYLDTMAFEGGVVRGTRDVFWTYQFTGAVDGLFELSQLPWLLGPAAAAMGMAGFLAFAWTIGRRRTLRHPLLPAAATALVYALIIVTWHAKFIRYLTPLLPILLLFCGYLVSRLDATPLRRAILLLAAAASILAGLMQAAIYQVEDPRVAAWNWLIPQLGEGDRIAIEPADLGPPYRTAPPRAVEIRPLPLLDPSSAPKVDEIAQKLAESRWIFIASRRHHSVLPRMTARFPEMCGYYDALWSGRLGFRLVSSFRRRPALPRALDPTSQAEETFTVFDSPQVFVFEKVSQTSAEDIAAEITRPISRCPEQSP